MFTPLLTLLFFHLHVNTTSVQDTLLYRSAVERRLIDQAIHHRDVDYTALYSSINTDSIHALEYALAVNNFYSETTNKVSNANSSKQKAKILFKEVHAHFFKKYEENVLFNKIFEDGTYNCLTATMLYAIILKRFNIPFEIKEKPSHVYIVAFPGVEDILFETTSPAGFYMPDEKARRAYIEALVSMKIITQEYVNSVGITQAFTEHYYNNKSITLTELAGLQYFNEALERYNSKNVSGSITSSIKSNLLYPCRKTLFLKSNLLGEALENSDFNAPRDIFYLAEYANGVQEGRNKKFVLTTFDNIVSSKLIKEGNDIFVSDAFHTLLTNVKDSAMVRDISYSYYNAMAYWQSVKGNNDETLQFAKKAFAINQKDVRLQETIMRAVAYKSDSFRGRDDSINMLNDYMAEFPFLKT